MQYKKIFNAVIVALVLCMTFAYCSNSKIIERTPSYSNTTLSEWNKLKPKYYDSCIVFLDKLLNAEAKNYYKNLDEITSTILMETSFGHIIDLWKVDELDTYFPSPEYGNYTGYLLKAKVICLGYYRHLNDKPYNFVKAKDSILVKFQPLKNKRYPETINTTALRNEQDSVLNNFFIKDWEINDTVKGGVFVLASGFKPVGFANYTGRIISKNLVTKQFEILIDELYLREKKISTYTNPHNKYEIYTVGNTIWLNPVSLRNLNKLNYR